MSNWRRGELFGSSELLPAAAIFIIGCQLRAARSVQGFVKHLLVKCRGLNLLIRIGFWGVPYYTYNIVYSILQTRF